MKVALLGATRGMGRALARADGRARRRRCSCSAATRDDLEKSARDLEARAGHGRGRRRRSATSSGPRRSRPRSTPRRRRSAGSTPWWSPRALFATQDALEADPELRAGACCSSNFTNTVVFCETRASACSRAAAARCACSARWPASAAASRSSSTARPRRGSRATSRGSTTSSAPQGLRTVCVKPGFVKTSMTEGLTPPPFAGEPEAVARHRAARHRPRDAGGLRARHLAAGDARDPQPAALRHAATVVLRLSARLGHNKRIPCPRTPVPPAASPSASCTSRTTARRGARGAGAARGSARCPGAAGDGRRRPSSAALETGRVDIILVRRPPSRLRRPLRPGRGRRRAPDVPFVFVSGVARRGASGRDARRPAPPISSSSSTWPGWPPPSAAPSGERGPARPPRGGGCGGDVPLDRGDDLGMDLGGGRGLRRSPTATPR